MATQPLNSANLNAFVKRIDALRPDSPRGWGSLTPAGLLAHLNTVVEMSLEEKPVVDASNFFTRHFLKRLVFQTPMPWPKGKMKTPPDFCPAPKTIDEERAQLIAAIRRFADAANREPSRKTLHPFFGPFTLAYWQFAHGKHFNYHFEQFGI